MSGTRQTQRAGTSRRVITAAARLFQERGFAATTIRDIAAECAVSVGTVMAVGDKNALLIRVVEGQIARQHDAAAPDGAERGAEATGHGAPDVAEAMLGLVDPFLGILFAHPELSRSYVSILVTGRYPSTLFSELTDRLTADFRAVLPSGPGREERARAAYRAYVGTLMMWSARGGEPDLEAVRTELREVFAAVAGTEKAR